MKYPRVAWSLLPALVGGVVIAFGPGDGPVGLADDLGSQPSTWWTDAGQTDHCEDATDRRDDPATDSYGNHVADNEKANYEYAGDDEHVYDYEDYEYEDYEYEDEDCDYEDYQYTDGDGEENAHDRKNYYYQGYKYVEAAPSESGNKDEEEEDSCEYVGARETAFTIEYDERYAEAHMHDLDYQGYSDAYPNEEDAYPEDLADAAAAEVYSYQYEYSYPEAKYGNVEALSNEIEQTEPENTSDPDDFKCFDEADEAASGEPGDEESQWFGSYDDETSVLDAVRSWTVRSLDELAMAIHGVSERISAQ